jgi:hypothetical protein
MTGHDPAVLTWQEVLAHAAPGEEARTARSGLTQLLSHALAGGDAEVVGAALREASQSPLLDVVEARLGRGDLSERERQAARAVLYVLPRLLRWLSLGEVPSSRVREALDKLVARAALDDDTTWPGARFVCPRCGAHTVDTQYTSAMGPRQYEAMCLACGHYASWCDPGDVPHPWARRR